MAIYKHMIRVQHLIKHTRRPANSAVDRGMYNEIPLRHVPMNQEICRFFRSVWDLAVFME